MRIAYIANLRLPTEKAYGIQIAKMCEAFADGGHKVTLFYPYRRNPAISQDIFSYYSVRKNFDPRVIKSRDFYLPGFLDKIAFLIKNYLSAKALVSEALKEGADVYYTRDEHIAYILSKKGKNVVFECHRFSNKKKAYYHYFKKIVAISNGLKQDLVKNGIQDPSILVAHDGVDLDSFNINMSKDEARERLNLPQNKKIILYTGHLFEWKGAGVLLESARIFKNQDTAFIFVGGTEPDIEKFKQRAVNFNNVLILGHKSHKDIPIFLKAADILILPNSAKDKISSYTSPLKLFEYMSSGRPIVASALPSISEILNGGNSILVSPDDPGKLADGIEKALSDQNSSAELAKRAFEDVHQYTWQKRVEKIIEFLGLSF